MSMLVLEVPDERLPDLQTADHASQSAPFHPEQSWEVRTFAAGQSPNWLLVEVLLDMALVLMLLERGTVLVMVVRRLIRRGSI